MTLSRNQLVLVILIVVVAGAVFLAAWYVEKVFKERGKEEDAIREGKTEELFPKPPPPPPGPPPLERSTKREDEMLIVLGLSPPTPARKGHSWGRTLAVIRGNGEFSRLPSMPDEPGPVVTGLLDRARVDDLIRAARTSTAHDPNRTGRDPPDEYRIAVEPGASRPDQISYDQELARRIMKLAGRSMNRSAIPNEIRMLLEPAEGEATAPWPLPRIEPVPGDLTLTVKGRDRDPILKLIEKDARFSHKDKIWRVVVLDMLR